MNPLLENLLGSSQSGLAQQLAKREGLDESQSRNLLESLTPLVLGGLKKKQEEGEDVEAFATQLGGHDDGLDDDESDGYDFFSNVKSATPSHLFGGDQEERAVQMVSQKTGLASGVVKKLLPILIPIILSKLMKNGRRDGATPDRRSGMGAILDRDGDGQIIDDLAGMVMGGQMGSQQGGGGLLSRILGMLFRRG